MNEIVKIENLDYQLITDFKDEDATRQSLNQLAQSVFYFNFEDWYQQGLWGDSYIPYSLLYNGKLISNVSITQMNLEIDGKSKKGLQIGTVMTDERFRNRGLNKYLLEYIINQWEKQVDFIYLFANDTVLDFYPKFNFHRIDQYQHSKPVKSAATKYTHRKLDLKNKVDFKVLKDSISSAIPVAPISDRHNVSLIMFYCLSFMKDEIYYFEELEAVVLAAKEENTLLLKDVFSKNTISLDDLIDSLADKLTKQVRLGFSPLDATGYTINKMGNDSDTLFIYSDKADEFQKKQRMFPVMSHA